MNHPLSNFLSMRASTSLTPFVFIDSIYIYIWYSQAHSLLHNRNLSASPRGAYAAKWNGFNCFLEWLAIERTSLGYIWLVTSFFFVSPCVCIDFLEGTRAYLWNERPRYGAGGHRGHPGRRLRRRVRQTAVIHGWWTGWSTVWRTVMMMMRETIGLHQDVQTMLIVGGGDDSGWGRSSRILLLLLRLNCWGSTTMASVVVRWWRSQRLRVHSKV